MAPFVERDHLVQNLGDGTFFHSGSLAVRAAVAAGVDITYKLLYNGTVAMTGGQDPDGQMSVPDVARDAAARRASPRVIVTSDDPDRYPTRCASRPSVDVWDRSRLDEAQRVLAEVAGRDRAHPRPGVRRREPPRPRTRDDRHARLPGRDQRAGLRGLRRLRRQEQLPVGAARRHAVRSQDPHPPDELQLRLLVPAGRLPVVRHRHRRRRAASASRPRSDPRPDRSARAGRSARRPRRRSPSAWPASAAPAWSPSARSSARPRCSPAATSAASTRPGCRRRPGRW